MTTFIKCNSHRSRQKLFNLLGKLDCFYNLSVGTTGGIYQVPDDSLDEVMKIKGITKASKKIEYCKCWG